ncbi:MAG: hypothetical protein DCC57_02155 [Chloroflexi bacterium]|nr:MAG: hypothetical protein DCC57_02155 [Chloroflexota bacterium]
MRKEVQETVHQFLAGALPRDPEFYRLHRYGVERLVGAIETQTGPLVTWEPPIDLFNFYHLQLPALAGERPKKRIGRRTLLAQATATLHILLSTYSHWAYSYWQHNSHRQDSLRQDAATGAAQQGPVESELFRLVQQVLGAQGWELLTQEEADEIVPDAQPTWPLATGPVFVRHLLFPGCAALLD